MRKSLRKIVASVSAVALALTLAAGIVPNTASATDTCSKAGEKAGKAKINLDAPDYHAYFGFQQTGSWIFRDTWYNPDTGLNGPSLKDAGLTFEGSMFQSGDNGLTKFSKTVVTDANITGNGTYSIGVTGIDGQLSTLPDDKISLIYVSTDIPSSAEDTIKFSDVKLTLDGADVTIPAELYVSSDAKEHGLYRLDIVNTYQTDGYESPSLIAPRDSMKITFTVSGFNADNADASATIEGEATPAPTADATSATSESGKTSESSSSSTTAVVVVVVVVVVVICGVVVVSRKKKNQ